MIKEYSISGTRVYKIRDESTNKVVYSIMQSFNEWTCGVVANYTVTRVEKQENKTFTWDKVYYKWSGFGPRPVFADDEKWTISNKHSKLTGEYNGSN